MKVLTALLLSSKQQAESYIGDWKNQYKMRYRLLVDRRVRHGEPDTYWLHFSHVSYPNARPGRGNGEPVAESVPYQTIGPMEREEFLNFLDVHDLDFEEGWVPVEAESTANET